MDSSSDSENEIINLDLMAKDYESGEEVISFNYDLSISFDELQDASNDLHKESVKISKLFSYSKKTISSLEKSKFEIKCRIRKFEIRS